MLLEKYDPQSPSIIFSAQGNTTDQHSGRPSVTKLPKILHIPSGHNSALGNDFLSANNLSAAYTPQLEKISPNTFENPVGRGPKIYTKHLPDVFTSGSAGIRSKRHPGIKERNKGDYTDQLSIDVITPTSRKSLNKIKLQPFANPAQLGQIPDTKGSQKLGKLDFYLPSMKENIEGLALKYDHENLSRGANLSKNEDHRTSPNRRSNKRIRIRTNIEYGPMLDKTSSNINSGRNISKEDELKQQIKQMVVFKKKASNTSESKFFDAKSEGVKVRLLDNLAGVSSSVPILQLNELITLRKMNTTVHNGVVKRMLHVPTFRMVDVLEEAIGDMSSRESYDIKDWINSWKMNFVRSKHLARVYSCFWNSPEGCVSIVGEAAKHGSLSDVLDLYGSIPEKSIQTIAKEMLHGIVEIHSRLSKPHGNINLREVIIDAKGTLKIAPGISYLFPNGTFNHFLSPKSPRTLQIRTSSKFSADLRSHSDYSQDIFDFGFSLLQCALGDFSAFNMTNVLTLEGIKQALGNMSLHKKSQACCLIHSEDLIRKAVSLNGTRRNKNGRRFKVADDSDNSFNSDTSYMSLYEILMSMNRFSENFINFLCSCLQIDPERRPKAEELFGHRFLSELHQPKGPLVSFKEFLGLSAKEAAGDVLKNIENGDERGFNRFGEALRVAFLNRNVKEKFDQMLKKSGKNELEGQKVSELASELGMSTHRLKRKLNECLQELQD